MSEALPTWVAEEIKDARWEFVETWKYSGYILDANPLEKRIDVQFYDRLPEGRYIATLDVSADYPIGGLKVGEAYVFEFRVFRAGLSERLTNFLQENYSINLKTIHRFELVSAEDFK